MVKMRRNDVDARVSAVIAAVKDNLHHPWTVADMAALVGVTDGQLRRLCSAANQPPPQQLLIELRLETAAQLLGDPRMRVKDIQVRVGIADGSHFCRDFRARFGMSPTEYRTVRGYANKCANAPIDPAVSRAQDQREFAPV